MTVIVITRRRWYTKGDGVHSPSNNDSAHKAARPRRSACDNNNCYDKDSNTNDDSDSNDNDDQN